MGNTNSPCIQEEDGDVGYGISNYGISWRWLVQTHVSLISTPILLPRSFARSQSQLSTPKLYNPANIFPSPEILGYQTRLGDSMELLGAPDFGPYLWSMLSGS